MESIALDTQSGSIVMGPYTIHPLLTFEEITSHKGVNSKSSELGVVSERYVYLPHVEFLGYQIATRLDFFSDQYVNAMYFHRIQEQSLDEDSWVTELREMVVWTRYIKGWLKTEFGSPHKISSPVFLDEDQWLTHEEVAHLDYWIYSYDWGEFGYTFHWETNASVHLHFDQHYQIGDWDGLRTKCRRYADSAQKIEILRNYSFIEAAIDTIAVNYDYKVARVLVTPDLRSLVFDLPHWSTKVVVTVQPDYPKKPFRIQRNDALRKEYSDIEHLPDVLRIFLETKEL